MAKLKEIEIKWDASSLSRAAYNKKVTEFLSKHSYKAEGKHAYGFDYYYESDSGRVARHRQGSDLNEITIKARLSNKSTTVRHEANIKITEDMPVTEVERALNLMGFNHSFSIYKDCDIYFIQDGKAEISIVWYVITVPKSQYKVAAKTFFEIEVHNVPEKESLKILNKWKKMLAENVLELSKKDIISESLYEIYTGKKYRLEQNSALNKRKKLP
jgi:adenylate cyclase class IV